MKRLTLVLVSRLLLCLGMLAQSASSASAQDSPNEQMLAEQKHFVECLSFVYSPAWWLSYHDALYFQPRNQAQLQQLEAMKTARSKYVALTNQETRHALAARIIAESGVGESWQFKLLLPLSATNQNLTPTLAKVATVVPKYKVLQSFGPGDTLIQDDASTYFVMNLGRGADDAFGTNALLIKEGVKAYSAGGTFKTVDAFSNVGLSKEETAVLNRVAAAFQREATALGQQIAALKDAPEFEAYKARATDSSPYMEYQLARAYLEGKGTEKNEQLGLDWMSRAARNGSGDAQSYLDARAHKAH